VSPGKSAAIRGRPVLTWKQAVIAEPSPPTKAGNQHRAVVLAGTAGGALGGVLGGALGGAFGSSIEAMAPPPLRAVLLGGLLWALGMALHGAVVGFAVGALLRARARPRVVFAWLAFATFVAALVGAVETQQSGYAAGILVWYVGVAEFLAGCLVFRRFCLLLWALRWPLLVWLIVCLAGVGYGRLYPGTSTPLTPAPAEPVVQLRCAPLPGALSYVAVHYWFVELDPDEGRWHRWELWQEADAGGTSWGHVHKDLIAPQAGLNRFPPQVMAEWRGGAARDLRAALAASPDYPHRGRYLAWPGPNSNTYIAWVLRRAGVAADLDPRGIGRDYLGIVGAGTTTTRTGLQVETPVVGLKVGALDGVELHFFYFTFGLDTWPPAVKTPLGRVGFPE
jgi:hypothetical protein